MLSFLKNKKTKNWAIGLALLVIIVGGVLIQRYRKYRIFRAAMIRTAIILQQKAPPTVPITVERQEEVAKRLQQKAPPTVPITVERQEEVAKRLQQ